MAERLPLILLLFSHLFVSGLLSMSILTIDNRCAETVWPVISSWQSQVSTNGFALRSGEARAIFAPSSWYGIISGRTLCSTDSRGIFSCATGDCESGRIDCPGTTLTYGWSAVTYVHLRIDMDGKNRHNISVAYGYNLPITVVTSQSSPTCISGGCHVDLNKTCPKNHTKLSSEKPIACSSPCQESYTPETCCAGDFNSKQNCKPTEYAQNFERACPLAQAYGYNYNTSTGICPNSTNYVITFCPFDSNPNIRSNNTSSMTPLAGPKHNSVRKLKPILGITFIATTTLMLINSCFYNIRFSC